MGYKIVFTGKGRDTYNNCIDYILYQFKDRFAADSLNDDIEYMLNLLERSPNSFQICESESLKVRKIRKVHLRKHNYKIFYHVDDETVFIDAIIHDKQDFERAV